jgi:hypothetical protein
MAKAIADHCAANEVDLVHVGWPKNFLRNVSYGSMVWAGRIHNFWSFAKTIAILKSAQAVVNTAYVAANAAPRLNARPATRKTSGAIHVGA